MNIINVQSVSYTYSNEHDIPPAIDNISFAVKEAEFVAVIGQNGSGKSTLAKHINALYLPGSGKVTVDGMDTKDESKVWKIRKCAGMVFQNPDNQLVATIVEEDVAFGPENIGIPPAQIRERVDAALSSVNMSEYADRAPHMLSGGQKQRVAIAGVLAMQPKIIVFDEPTAMLDPEGRKEVLSTIAKLNKSGKTILLITHYMEEALYADSVIVMKEGRIMAKGTPREIFADEELLADAGLEAPPHIALYHRLKNKGFKLGECPLSTDELVEKICLLS